MLKLKSVNFEQRQFQNHHLDQSYPGQLEWMIGRNATSDLVLPNPEVSRVHGQIVYSDDAYHFVDVGSTSGTLLNGEVVSARDRRPLRPGDLLQIGETFLYVEELAPPTPVSFVPAPATTLPLPDQPWTEGDLQCRCCRIIDETLDVKTFCLVAESPVFFNYQPGQFVNVQVVIDGKPVIRPYSISSSPTRPYHLSITVKRVPSPSEQPDVPAGLVSNWLHDHLQVGDRINLIGGPIGHFTCLPQLPAKLLLISAGSGITPMMSMSRWVQDSLADTDLIFLHSARSANDLPFRTELETMAAQMPNFHLAVTVTRQLPGQAWMGFTGRISKSLLHLVAPDLLERSVFVCGPDGFMQGIKTMLEAMSFPMQNYQQESFGGKKPSVSSTKPVVAADRSEQTDQTTVFLNNGSGNSGNISNGNGHHASTAPLTTAPAVTFAKSDKEVLADDCSSILELAEQEGVTIPNACRVGACGACKVMTRQGQVRYDAPPAALTPTDQQAGYTLACVAYAVDRVVVEA
jgi:glycine betaine catabolism B